MTRQELDAQTAKDWGAVNEIVPVDKLLTRAHEIAEGLAKLPCGKTARDKSPSNAAGGQGTPCSCA
jgi:enoyl-CoA hydratase/carnithine racemase